MKKTVKLIPIILLIALLVFGLAIGILTTNVPTDGVAEAADITISTLTLNDMKSGLGGAANVDDYTPVGEWTARGFYKDGGNVYMDYNYTGRICYTIPAGYKATSITYSATFGSAISMFKLRKGENGSYYVNVASSGDSVDGTTNFTEDFNAGDEFRLFINSSSGNLLVKDLTLTIKGAALSSPVTITKGTGLKSVYLSTSNTATSGSASGTEYTNGSTVYGFAELAKGYKSKSGWALVSGTADTESAKYRIGSKTVNSAQDFGTISADLITYSITYNLNSGTHGTTHPSSYNVTTATFTISNPTRTGYTFKGWSGTGLSGDSNTSVSIAKGSIGNRTYTANWTANQYNITYKDQGNANFSGTHESGYPTQHTYGTATTLKGATKAGYVFDGWFTASNCSGSAITSIGATDYTNAITLYAKWTAIPATAPTIDTQPLAYTGDYGETGSLTVEATAASGHTLSYQWYCDNQAVAGATDATYAIENTHSAGAFQYYCAVTATRTDNSQINTVNSSEVTVTINKIAPTPIADEDKPTAVEDLKYTGNPLELVVAGAAREDGEVWYSLNGGAFSNTIPTASTTGTYTVHYMIHGDGNHNDMSNDSWYFTVTISPVDKTEIANAITSAEAYYDSIVADYPNEAADLLAGINAAKAIRDDNDKTEDEVDDAISALLTVVDVAHADVVDEIINVLPDMSAVDYVDEDEVEDARAELEAARTAYDALTDAQKSETTLLTDLEAAEAKFVDGRISVIPDQVAITDADYINAVRAEYDGLSAGAKANVTELDNLDIAEVKLCEAFIGQINIPEDTQAFRDRVQSSRDAYNNLRTDAQRDSVDSSIYKYLVDCEAAIAVMDIINAIGDVEYNATSKGKIDAANDAYAALSTDQKALVANIDKLTQANTDYDNVDAVVGKIDTIGTVEYSDGCKDLIDDVRENYDDLTQYQKSILPQDKYDVLVNDEAAYGAMDAIHNIAPIENNDEFRQRVADAQTAVNNLSADQLALVIPDFLDDLTNAVAVNDAMNAINAIGEAEDTQAYRDAVSGARTAFDDLTNEQEALFPADALKILTDDEAAVGVMDVVNAIGDVEYNATSKGKIDAANDAYNALTDDQKPLVANIGTLTQANTDYDKVDELVGKINAIGDTEYTEEFKGKLDEAIELYEGLSDYQKSIIPDNDMTALEEAEFDYAVLEAEAKIDAIGTVEYSPECKAKIDEAKQYYDSLSDAQKAEINNYDDLEKAHTDYYAVDAVVNDIDDIENIRYDERSDNAITGARENYEDLTDDQKALMPSEKVKDLTDSEAAYATLEKIAAIGEVGYNDVSEDNIKKAREAYNELTPEQKALINVEDVKTLENSEQEYGKLNNTASSVYTAFLVIAAVAVAAALFFLGFMILKIRKLKKSKSTKMMSVTLLPIIAVVSYYTTAPFIALYVLAAILVLIVIADLVLLMKYKKSKQETKKSTNKAEEVANKEDEQVAEENDTTSNVVVSENTSAIEEDSDEEDEDGGIVVDSTGNYFNIRYNKSFTAKLIQAGDETKNYYGVLKNEILSYKKTKSRISWAYDSINSGREQLVKFSIRGKTLCVYFNLNADDYADSKYKVEKVETSKFETVPCMYRIKNDRRLQYAKDLIATVCEKAGLVKGDEQNENYYVPYEKTEPLLERGLIKELKLAATATQIERAKKEGTIHTVHKVSVEQAHVMISDEVAASAIKNSFTGKLRTGKKAIINVDTLSANFKDGDKITVHTLKEKKLITASVGQVKLLARGNLDKVLHVELQDYSMDAVKMIIATGGTVKRC